MTKRASKKEREVTKTTLLRDAVMLELRGIELQKAKCERGAPLDLLTEERDLKNILETLKLGFDPARFDAILDLDEGDVTSYLVRCTDFNYYLYVKMGGLDYVVLDIQPAKKTFSLIGRTSVDEHLMFSYGDMDLERVSYGERDHFVPTEPYTGGDRLIKLPQIVIRGKFYGIPIELCLDKHSIRLAGGTYPHGRMADSPCPLYLSLPLTTREQKHPKG